MVAASKPSVLREFKRLRHRHNECVADAVAVAERRCSKLGYRLTTLRRRVLELVWASHEPVKAYDVLSRLQTERDGAAPPTVYRALEILQEVGLVHRIESLNAFVGCGNPERSHLGQFLICRLCGTVAEIDDADITALIARKADELGFAVDRETIEVEGLCTHCRQH